jgi:hypothetical protein
MLKEVIILVNEGLDEDLCVLWDGQVTLKNLCTKLSQKLLPMDDIVNIFIMLACFSN